MIVRDRHLSFYYRSSLSAQPICRHCSPSRFFFRNFCHQSREITFRLVSPPPLTKHHKMPCENDTEKPCSEAAFVSVRPAGTMQVPPLFSVPPFSLSPGLPNIALNSFTGVPLSFIRPKFPRTRQVGRQGLRRPRGHIISASSRDSQSPAYRSFSAPSWASSPDLSGSSSFLQCVECRAVYAVDSDELEGEPRVVRCCACLHEWYASESDLIWGDRDVAAAIETARILEEQKKVLVENAIGSDESSPQTQGKTVSTSCDQCSEHETSTRGTLETDINRNTNEKRSREQGTGSRISGTEGADYTSKRGTGSNCSYTGDGMPTENAISSNSKLKDDFEQLDLAGSAEDMAGRSSKSSQNREVAKAAQPESPEVLRGDSARVETKSASKSSPGSELNDGDSSLPFNIFVGNLSFRATEEDLYSAFRGYGKVIKCQVPFDAIGCSRGYGFVEMASQKDGRNAIENLQGASILGREVSLCKARVRRSKGSDATGNEETRSTSFRDGVGEKRTSFVEKKQRNDVNLQYDEDPRKRSGFFADSNGNLGGNDRRNTFRSRTSSHDQQVGRYFRNNPRPEGDNGNGTRRRFRKRQA